MEITVRHVVEVPRSLELLLLRLAQALEGAGLASRAEIEEQDGAGGAVGAAGTPGAGGGPLPPVAASAAAAGLPGQNAPAAAERGEKAGRAMGQKWRAPEREAGLRELWLGHLSTTRVRMRLAAMDGEAMPSGNAALYRWAGELGLPTSRPSGESRVGVGQTRAGWRTAERRALLLEAWSEGVSTPEIIAQMEALPGDPLPKDKALHVGVWAAELGRKRPPGFRSEVARGVNAARQETAAAPKAAAPAGPGEAAALERAAPPSQLPALVVPVASAAPKPPPLPAPAEDGTVYASFAQLRAWAGFYAIAYDGSNVDRLNKFRAAKGLPPVVQDEAVAA